MHRAAVMAVVLAFAMSLARAAWVPGIAQEKQHEMPGGVDIVMAAAPDRNVDLYLIPDGNPEATIEFTHTPVLQERYPTLAPDGRSIVYAVDAQDGSTDLRLMTLDDRGQPTGSRCCSTARITCRRRAGRRMARRCCPFGHRILR